MVTKNGPKSGSARIMRKPLQLSSLSQSQLIAPHALVISSICIVCKKEKSRLKLKESVIKIYGEKYYFCVCKSVKQISKKNINNNTSAKE